MMLPSQLHQQHFAVHDPFQTHFHMQPAMSALQRQPIPALYHAQFNAHAATHWQDPSLSCLPPHTVHVPHEQFPPMNTHAIGPRRSGLVPAIPMQDCVAVASADNTVRPPMQNYVTTTYPDSAAWPPVNAPPLLIRHSSPLPTNKVINSHLLSCATDRTQIPRNEYSTGTKVNSSISHLNQCHVDSVEARSDAYNLPEKQLVSDVPTCREVAAVVAEHLSVDVRDPLCAMSLVSIEKCASGQIVEYGFKRCGSGVKALREYVLSVAPDQCATFVLVANGALQIPLCTAALSTHVNMRRPQSSPIEFDFGNSSVGVSPCVRIIFRRDCGPINEHQ